MTPEQARLAYLAYDFLYHYVSTNCGGPVPSDAEFVDLAAGNFLVSETLAGMLAKFRGKTFDQVLDDLPEHDEGYPSDPAATPMWDATIDQLRYVHAHSWQRRPEPSSAYDLPTVFRSSFNLVVALAIEAAAATHQTSRQLASLLRAAAAAEMQ